MAGITISGLISGSFDWKSVVDQLIKIESAPIARLQTEESKNIDRLASLTGLKTGLTGLQTAVNGLAADGLFNGRTAASTTAASGWTSTAASNTAIGSYTIAVSQLASAARHVGTSSISTNLNAAADGLGTDPNSIAGLTLATLPTATAITAGESFFSINGVRITINSADSLESVFTEIFAQTGGQVTASYDASTDKVSLSSAGPMVLGAANDSSNFLQVMRLANNTPGTTITSSSALGAVSLNAPLISGRLNGALGAVSPEGDGRFAVNGVDIDYNVNTDSLSTVLSRISASSAGVTASYDLAADRVILTNKTTGDVGMSVTDSTGSLALALGITTSAPSVRGKNAQFTVNGGDLLSSSTNTFGADLTGVAGLSVTVNSETTQTINVAANTTAMKAAIEDFITKFNDVQTYVDAETKIVRTPDGKVTTGLLAGNHEVESWASRLRSLAFAQVPGLSGTIKRLESLGIDFSSTDSSMALKDASKLDAALANNTTDVAAFFQTSSTGFAAVLDTFLDSTLDESSGPLATQVESLNNQNTSIEAQIATLNRRIEHQRQMLTTAFLAMQTAQSVAQQQQTALTNMYNSMNKDS